MNLLYPYPVGTEYEVRQKESMEFLQEIVNLGTLPITIIARTCNTVFDYSDAIGNLWQCGDLVIMEHDIVPTLRDLELMRILLSRHPLVAFPYLLYPQSTLLERIELAHRVVNDTKLGWRWANTVDDLEVDFAGLGFSGISQQVQQLFSREWFYDSHPWVTLDTELSLKLQRYGLRWYMPKVFVKHNHE